MAANPSGDDNLAGNPFVDMDGDVHANGTTVYVESATAVFAEATIKNIAMTGVVAVTVPTIADAEMDEVEVTIGAGATFAPAVGDAVIALPQEALPTSCLLLGAYVSGADKVKVSFGTLEGGSGVTGAAKNFKFLFLDVT